MALMICPDCGNQVSDKANRCPVCGCPKSAIVAFKEEEQAKLEESIQKQRKDKRNRILKISVPVVAAIVIVLTVVAILFGIKGAAEKNGYFANIPWGTDIKTVQKKVDKAFKCESSIGGKDKDAVIAPTKNYDGMKGVNALLVLDCKDKGTLNEVSIMFFKDDSRYTIEKIADELIGKYDKLFGKADGGTGSISGFRFYKWKTKNSTINLINSGDSIMLTYKK